MENRFSGAKARILEAFRGMSGSRDLPKNIAPVFPKHCHALPKSIHETSGSEDARNFHLPDGTTLVTMHASL
jgi:hypothetical protein